MGGREILTLPVLVGNAWRCQLSYEALGRAAWDSFFQHVAFKVGEGNQIRFWYDLSSGHLPLKYLQP